MTDAQEPRCKQAENDGNDRPSERADERPERTDGGGERGMMSDAFRFRNDGGGEQRRED